MLEDFDRMLRATKCARRAEALSTVSRARDADEASLHD